MFLKRTASIILLLLFCSACHQKTATMNYQDIHIYCSAEDKEILMEIVDNYLFVDYYNTPEPEKKYNPVWHDVHQFLEKSENSVIMLLSIDEPLDTTTKGIYEYLSRNIDNENNTFLINDYFVKNQLLFMVNEKNKDLFINEILNQREWIVGKIHRNERLFFKNKMDRSNINIELSTRIEDVFGITMTVQEDYELIKDDEDNKYLWIGRAYPYRWIYIYEDEMVNYIDTNIAWESIDLNFNKQLKIDIMTLNREFEIVNNSSYDSKKISGIYGTQLDSDNLTGGPFVTYIIEKNETNKVLVASGFVNFPGGSKVFHIKELEYIIESIKEYNNGK